jgi:hypothetical protein
VTSIPFLHLRGAEKSNVMFLGIPWPMLRTTMLVGEAPGVVGVHYDLGRSWSSRDLRAYLPW